MAKFYQREVQPVDAQYAGSKGDLEYEVRQVTLSCTFGGLTTHEGRTMSPAQIQQKIGCIVNPARMEQGCIVVILKFGTVLS